MAEKVSNDQILVLRDNAREQLMQIKTVEDGISYMNKLKSIEVWVKAEKKDAELQNIVAEQKLRTQRILGELISEGQRKGTIANKGESNYNSLIPDGNKRKLDEIGITPKQSSTFQQIASIPQEDFEEFIAEKKLAVNNAVAELTTTGMLQLAKDVKKQTDRQEKADAGKKVITDIDFRLGDFEEVFADLADGGVDCVITDPPYPYEFIECWTKLSRFAKRVLKPNGYCIAYSGQMNLPETIKRMSENLDYYWTFAVYHEGATQIVNGVNIMCRWKPVLIFQNGKKKLQNTIQDYFISEQREKAGHDWQQSVSGVSYLIEMFTEPNEIIFEPFAGSGTTIIAAKQMGRQVLAAEMDEQTYNIAKSNL